MIAKVFAALGSETARKRDSLNEEERLRALLRYLEAADNSLEESDYVFIEGFFPTELLSEFRQEYRALRREYAIRGCKFGIIECRGRRHEPEDKETAHWREEERKRLAKRNRKRGRKPDGAIEHQQPEEPLEFTPGKFRKEKETDDPIEESPKTD